MKRILFVIIFLLIFAGFTSSASAVDKEAGASATLKLKVVEAEELEPDLRGVKLRQYLESHNSPLAEFADVFVYEADKYNLPWNLIVAITGVESTFGKHIPYNSYNAYGWANGAYYFSSWEESIAVVSQTLREKYYNQGANTVEKIAPIYAPLSSTWASKVRFLMNQIDKYLPQESTSFVLNW